MRKIPWVWVLGAFAAGAILGPKVVALSGGRLPQVGR